MCGPDEAGGDDGVAFVVGAQATVVDQPGPGPFDDPAVREDLEGVSVGPGHDFGVDLEATAEPPEGGLEPGVTPHLGEPAGLERGVADSVDAADVVRGVGRDHHDRQQQTQGVDDTEGLATGDLLADVISPSRTTNSGRALGAAGVHDPRRRLRFAALALTYQRPEAVHDSFPGAVPRPGQVVAVPRVPVRVAARQRPPLAPGRGDIEDRVDDVALGVGGRASHPAPTREGRHQISDQLPLLITEILLTRLPGLRRATTIPCHTRSLRGTNTRAPQTSANFHNSL